MERLSKVLASCGVASRRGAERLIEEGRVSVNGQPETRLGTRVDPRRDAIKVDGRRIHPPARARHTYLLLNKPRGVVTTLSDPEGRRTVRDLLRGVRARVYPVGRLDYHTEGLLLLTDDGELARDLMHPRRGVPKTYLAKVRGQPDGPTLSRLATGIVIEGRRTLPVLARTVRRGRNAWVELTVTEGRKHQVRRMLQAVGHPVMKLRRTRYAGLGLAGLAPGQFRPLTADEIAGLRRAAGGSPAPRKVRSRRENGP